MTPPSRVGERYDGTEEPVGCGEFALEFKGLPFGAPQEFDQVHYSEVYSEGSESSRLQS